MKFPDPDSYQICIQCVMDTTDPCITFDARGVCSHCHEFSDNIRKDWFPNELGWTKLGSLVHGIKEENRSREYDCILGLSGGIDSAYVAYVAREMLGLRVLAVHVDAGWNSELAVKNIENIVKRLGIDLHTHVVDWDEMRDLQVAFFKSGIANQDVPQDHAFFAALYHFATKNGINWVLSGGNIATESVLPRSWGYNAMDLRHLRAIHKKYGKVPLRTYPTCNFFEYYFYYPYIRNMQVLRPLNFMPYVKEDVLKLLEDKIGYRYYNTKHGESRFTKFYQNYWLPFRFGFDKRKAHFSSMILSGQMTRGEAIVQLDQETYVNSAELDEDRAFIVKKLGLTDKEFDELLRAPVRSHNDFASNAALFSFKDRIKYALNRFGFSFRGK